MNKENKIKTEFIEIVNREYAARRYSESVTNRNRESRIKKAKAKFALSIIGGAIMSLPILYGMLFLVTLV